MGPSTEISGGSAANTIAGVASFGGRAAFVGKVKDDLLGKAFTHDIRASGVTFNTPPAKNGPATAVATSSHARRRAAHEHVSRRSPKSVAPDVSERKLRREITYLEGISGIRRTRRRPSQGPKIAHGPTHRARRFRLVCFDRYRAEFIALVRVGLRSFVSNESELNSSMRRRFRRALQR